MKMLLAMALFFLVSLQSTAAGEGFACNLKALGTAQRARHHELTGALFAAVAEKTELPNGYGFRLSAKDLTRAAEWVSLEARCCPFFAFELAQSRDQGPLWLKITGADGVKAFIRSELER
jgi:hypothetical protein